MGLMKLAAVGAAGYAIYRMARNNQGSQQAAAEGPTGLTPDRGAGPEAMATNPPTR